MFQRARGSILIACVAALSTFLIMTVTRPEPKVQFVPSNGSFLPSQPLDGVVTKVYDVHDILKSFADAGRDFWRSPSGFVPESAPPTPPGSRPFTFEEAQAALEKLVSDNVAAQTWKMNGGTIGELQCTFGRLVVIQTPSNQDAIEKLLFLLAKPESLKPPPLGIMLPDHSLRYPATQ